MPQRNNAWIWFAGTAAVAIVAQRFASGTLLEYSLYMAIDVFCIVAMFVGLRMNRPVDARPWRWLLGSQIVFFAADAVFYTMRDLLKLTAFPTPADALYVAHYAFLFVAILGFARRRNSGTRDRGTAIDAGIAGIAAALVFWLVWVGPSLAGNMPLLTRGVIAVYPVADIALFTISLRLLAGRGARPVAFWVLNAAFLALFMGDALLGWQQSRGTYSIHNIDDAMWLAHLALVATAALHPSMRDMARTATRTMPKASLRSVALAISAAVPPVALLFEDLTERSDVVAIAAATVAMYSLVVLRLHLATREQIEARRLLEQNEVRLEEAVELLEAGEQVRTRLIEGVVAAAENERTWIAADLHDGPIQRLAAIGFGIDRVGRQLSKSQTDEAFDTLAAQRDDLSHVIAELRRLMSELRPPALDQGGLDGAIRDYAAAFSRDAGVPCATRVYSGEARLNPKTETIVYRVVQEALTNVRKHAAAAFCEVVVQLDGSELCLEVRDNGRGFDPSEARRFVDEQHFGVTTMRERVEIAGGTWALESGADGTVIRARIPAAPIAPARAVA
jgi:signal transduction histidine kinase